MELTSLVLPAPSCSLLRRRPLLANLPSSARHHNVIRPPRRRPRRVPSFVRGAIAERVGPSASSSEPTPPPPPAADERKPIVLGEPQELSGPQAALAAVPPTARLAASALVVVAAAAAGYGLGARFGGTRNIGIGGAAALGVASGAAVYAANAAVPEVAATVLHNLVVGHDDPLTLRKEDVEAVANKYGVSMQDETFKEKLCELYSRFLNEVLPPGGEDLKGNEVEKIIQFKKGLGIEDPDAATAHMEAGRRIFRERLEAGDRDGDVQQRRAFQKLVYVSSLVFGEASKFLLPWKRIFKVTDSQVEIAVRDNAQRLYAIQLNKIGRDVNAEQLISLRQSQLLYKLSDDIASEMFRERTRKLAEEYISSAVEVLKFRTKTRGMEHVIEETDKVVYFNNSLTLLKQHPDAGQFALGIGPLSLVGGEFDGDRKMDDLKLLYKAYAADSFSGGRLEETKLSALNQLKNIFGLGKREAEAIVLDVTSKVYRKRLSRAVSSGDLDIATSKAAYLQKLCEELHFDPLKAKEIHEEIYRQKLQQCLADEELSEDDVKALLRLRVMLCIPQDTIDAAHADICGRLFEKVVKDAIASGVEGYDTDVRASVQKASKGLRLTQEAAMNIASKAVRKVFLIYIQRARSAGSRNETAKELKKMIAFNTLVVTRLISDIKGEPTTSSEDSEPVKEEENKNVDEAWERLQSLRKTRPNKELEATVGKQGQTEITLKDDLPDRDRTDLYRTYLLFCLSGEVTTMAFGAQITTKKDNSEFLLLNQLGGILGLTAKEIVEIHKSLAEQAFTKQAEVILADGQLTKARIEQLNEVQKQVGLPAELAQKVIKNITTTKMAAAIETAVNQGRLNIKQVRELKEASIDIDTIISEKLRESLFKKSVDEIFSSGTGEFDAQEVYERIPKDLSIDPEKAKGVVHELAKTMTSNSLIQAVALLRQRRREGAVSSLNDMLACDTAVPSQPLSWSSTEELADLYRLYFKSDPKPEKLSRLQYLLGISDSAAETLRDSADPVTIDEEEEFAF